VVCLAPRVPGEIVGPRRLSGVVVRPLNFTVRRRMKCLLTRRRWPHPAGQYLSPLLSLALLSGCEGPHALITNMTQAPIKVTYSIANIHDNAVTLEPRKSAGSFGARPGKATRIVVVQSDGLTREYSRDALSALRPRLRHNDCFGYFEDGLRSLDSCPNGNLIPRK
jgi:hypothetical protein